MADVIARLQVDSSQYDQKLKKAVEQMTKMEQEVRRTGATFEFADKAELEFVRSLGQMESSSTSARTKMMEYTNAIASLTATYRAMTDEERKGDFGQGLAASIDELKVKAATLKDIMSDTNIELTNLASDTNFTDGLNLMTRTIGTSASAIVAWTGDSKEMEAVIKDLAKIGTTVAAVDQLTKAFQKQNLVLLKNPYVAAAAAVVALGVAIGKLIQKSQELDGVQKTLNEVQAKGRDNAAKEMAQIDTLNSILHDNTRSLEERRSALAQIQSLVPDYHGALTAEGTLINDNTGAIDDYIDSLQRAATAQAAFDKMVELQKKKMQQQVELQEKQKELQVAQARNERAQGEVVYAGSEMTQVYTQMNTSSAERAVQKAEADIRATDAEIDALRNLVKATDVSNGTTTTATTGKGGKTATTNKTEEAAPEGSIKAMREQLSGLQKDWELATDDDSRKVLKDQIDEVSAALDKMIGKTKEAQQVTKAEPLMNFSEKGLANLGSQIKGKMSGAEIGSADYMLAADQLLDFTTFENLLKAATERGVQPNPEWMASLFEDIKIGADIDEDTWQAVVDHINELIEGTEFPSIDLDVKTGKVEAASEAAVTNAKDTAAAWQNAVAAVNNVGSALQQIEDPAAKVSGIVMQAIANVALGFAQASASAATGAAGVFGWIAAATAGVATMVSTIAAIKSATAGSYASGGIVPGSSFSGDNLTANVNSGELILNRAQQASIAGQLSGGATQTVVVEGRISGKDILLSANNTNRAAGGSRGYYTKVK